MSAIALPALPWQAEVKCRLIDFAGDMTPALGGPSQRIARLGSRYAVDVTLPRLDQDCARAWGAARKKARTLGSTVLMAWPKVPAPGSLGTPLVNGSSQAGADLDCKGFTHGVTVKADQPFSVVVSGRTYLYFTTDEATADGSGLIGGLPIAPILRASPAANAALEFVAPKIEGFLSGTTEDWDVDVLSTVGMSFTVTEAE